MNLYYNKYIKYKNKYLKLKTQKKQIGKGSSADFQEKITFHEDFCIGRGDYFHQHSGECWNDAIQMLFCFSDEIKTSVQSKLFNLTPVEIIDLSYLENREKYLTLVHRGSNTESSSNVKFKKRLIKYLTFLQKRLCSHIIQSNPDKTIPKCNKDDIETNLDDFYQKYNKYLVSEEYYYEEELYSTIESLPKEIKDNIEPQIYDMNMEDALYLLKKYLPPLDPKIKLKRQKSEIHGIGSAMTGIKLANVIKTIEDHGASLENQLVLLNYLSFSLLDNDNILKTDYINEMNYLTDKHIEKSFAVLVFTPSHETLFYICDSILMYYDNNLGKFNCNWKNILYLYLEYKTTHELIICRSSLKFDILFKNKFSDECLKINEMEIILENTDINLYQNWTEYIVDGLLFIKKVNLNNKKEKYIHDVLENQFIMSDLLNGLVPNVKNQNNIIYYLTKIDPINMKKILYNMDNISDKNIAQKILFNLVTMTELTEKDLKLFKLLMCSGVDFNYKYFDKITISVILATFSYSEANNKIMDFIIDQANNINEIYFFMDKTILELSIDNNNIKLVKLLIKKGANINRKNKKGETIIIQLLKKKIIDEDDSEEINDEENYTNDILTTNKIIKLLIKHRIDLCGEDQNGKTVFELAIENMKLEILDLLIKYGIDINKKLSTGETALFYMMHKSKKGINYLDFMKLLICSGIDIDSPNSLGISPLLYIIMNEPYNQYDYIIVKILLNAGANYIRPNELIEKSSDVKMKEIFESIIHKL